MHWGGGMAAFGLSDLLLEGSARWIDIQPLSQRHLLSSILAATANFDQSVRYIGPKKKEPSAAETNQSIT